MFVAENVFKRLNYISWITGLLLTLTLKFWREVYTTPS